MGGETECKSGGCSLLVQPPSLPLTGQCCRLMQSQHHGRICFPEAGTAPLGLGWALPRLDPRRGRSLTVPETLSPSPGRAPINNESLIQCEVPRPWLHRRGRGQLPQRVRGGGWGGLRAAGAGQGCKKSASPATRGGASGKGPGRVPLLGLRKAPKMAGGNSASQARRRHRGRLSDRLGQPTNCPQHPPPAAAAAHDWLSWPRAPCRGGAATPRPRFPPRWRACAQTPLESI